jgi:sulfur carrier protein ThiS
MDMKIRLTYTGYLKFDGAKSGAHIDVEEGSTIADVLAGFDVPAEQQRFLKLFANDEKADPAYVMRDGDELTVIMQIGGG